MGILLDLMQKYREKAGDKVSEKGGSIFTKACFLLALLLQDRHRAAVCTVHTHADNTRRFPHLFTQAFTFRFRRS